MLVCSPAARVAGSASIGLEPGGGDVPVPELPDGEAGESGSISVATLSVGFNVAGSRR